MSDEQESRHMASPNITLAALFEEYDSYETKHEVFDHQYDDLLQRLMSVLSELPDIPMRSFRMQASSTTTGKHSSDDHCSNEACSYLDDIVASFIDGETKVFPRRTKINRWSDSSSFPVFDTNLLDEHTSTVLQNWEKGLVLLSKVTRNMLPSEFHTTASLANFVPNEDNDTNNDSCDCQMYRITCILLSCRAIRQLGATVTSHETQCPRWQRCQSLLFETIRQYDQFHAIYGNNQSRMHLSLSMWIHHVVPSTSQWNCVLWNEHFPWEHIRIPTDRVRVWRWRMAYEAVTVAIAGRLAFQLVTQGNDCENVLRSVVSSISDKIVSGRLDWICDHFWRSYQVHVQSNQLVLQTYKNSLKAECGPTDTFALSYFTLCAGGEEDNDECWDRLCGLHSTWSNTSTAILSSVAWDIRPSVWSKDYQWSLFFPSINDLLSGGVTDSAESQRRRGTIVPYGFALLSKIIALCTTRSIKKPSNDDAPDSPLGTFQLLFNYILSQTDDRRGDTVVTATECFRTVKLLMNVYQPCSQVNIVKKLLSQCPYPNLRPKMIDLLRTFVDWSDAQGESKVWALIDETFFIHIEDRLNSGITPLNIDALVDDAEIYVACVGLLQAWVKRKRMLPVYEKISHWLDRLAYIHASLTKIMTEPNNTPENSSSSCSVSHIELHFQLNLLENIIKDCIDDITIAKKYQNYKDHHATINLQF